MSWGYIRANWKQFQRQAKLRWDRLTDEDVARIKGHRDVLLTCLEERYGYAMIGRSRKCGIGSTISHPEGSPKRIG